MPEESKGTRQPKTRRPSIKEHVRAALRDVDSEQGRAALVALLDLVGFIITSGPHGADLAAEIYAAAHRANKRNRAEREDDTLPGRLEAYAAHFRSELLNAVDGEHKRISERMRANYPGVREREDRDAPEACAYLSRFTGRTAEAARRDDEDEWPEYIGREGGR